MSVMPKAYRKDQTVRLEVRADPKFYDGMP